MLCVVSSYMFAQITQLTLLSYLLASGGAFEIQHHRPHLQAHSHKHTKCKCIIILSHIKY